MQGYQPLDAPAQFLRRARALGRFVDRATAEQEPAWKQWIPYCMLRCGDWGPTGRPEQRGVLLVQRTRGQSEARLHESRSIGLGGHIEPVDDARVGARDADPHADPEGFFARALGRELEEELRLPPGLLPPPRLLGLINDDSTEVGRVHAGLAYTVDLPCGLDEAREAVGIREISKMRGGFTSLVELARLWLTRTEFESWSQFLIQAEIVGAMGGRSEGPRGSGSWDGSATAAGGTGLEN